MEEFDFQPGTSSETTSLSSIPLPASCVIQPPTPPRPHILGSFKQALDKFTSCFEDVINQSLSIAHVKPEDRLIAIKGLLASMQSFCKYQNPQIETVHKNDVALFLSNLNRSTKIIYNIVHDPISSQEIIILSSLTLSLLYYNSSRFSDLNELYAIENYFRQFSSEDSRNGYVCDLKQSVDAECIERLWKFKIKSNRATFIDIAFIHGLLNCSYLMQVYIEQFPEQFFLIFDYISVLFKHTATDEYHLFQVFRDYSRLLLENYIKIAKRHDEGVGTLKSFSHFSVFRVVKLSIKIIDLRWESPAANVGKLLKETYQCFIIICANICPLKKMFKDFLGTEMQNILRLPFTSKAKYNKLSILIKEMSSPLTDSFLIYRDHSVPFFLYPFLHDQEFAKKSLEHLSINSLTHSIVEFYKKSVQTLAANNNNKMELSDQWSMIWLDAIKNVFIKNVHQSSIINNTMVAHLLPFTLQHVPDSFPKLWNALDQFPYGQITIVKIESRNPTFVAGFNLGRSWIEEMLQLGDDMSRLEALSLLVEENFIQKNRPLICELILKFLRCNLNIDNANVRLKIVSTLEKYFKKIIPSISTRYTVKCSLMALADNDAPIVRFLKDTLDFLIVSLIPGSSFQRKFTSLSIFASMLKVFDKEDPKRVFLNLFKQFPNTCNWHHGLVYGLIDKDDRIRKMVTEALISLSFHYFSDLCSFEKQYFYEIYNVSMKLLKSPRHQETHIGGLMLKYLFYSFHVGSANQTSIGNPGFQLLQCLVNKTIYVFNSELFRKNILLASRKEPLHGYLLALNQILNSCFFMKGIAQQNIIKNDLLTLLIRELPFREHIFQPLLIVCNECIEYFLNMLTPNSDGESGELYEDEAVGSLGEDHDDNAFENYSSPSFLQMGDSIVQIIMDANAIPKGQDYRSGLYQSNDFQLILSMAWLNIKESCFLLTSLLSCFASMLELFVANRHISGYKTATKHVLSWIQPEELYLIGAKITEIMLRCRHKGVIEAAGKSLSIYTQKMIQIQCYLEVLIREEKIAPYSSSMERFVNDIISIVDVRNSSGSVTRRAAGLAFIVQAVLSGEVMAQVNGKKQEMATYNKIVGLLIHNSQLPVDMSQDYQSVDLPQANCLHILRSIVTTSELSHMTMKTVVELFPLCVTGFRSPIWSIRNACLQLFGACVQRMLGQKKRVKTADSELANELGTTITFDEFASRYPMLIPVIINHFNGYCFDDVIIERRRRDLVPIIALLRQFTPERDDHLSAGYNDNNNNSKDDNSELVKYKAQIVKLLKTYLKSPIWKIRSLSAEALAVFMKWQEFEEFVASLKKGNYSHNEIHGLMMLGDEMCKKYSKDQQENPIMESISQLKPEFAILAERLRMHDDGYDLTEPLYCCPEEESSYSLDLVSDTSRHSNLVSSRSSGFFEQELSEEFIDYLNESISFRKPDNIRKEGSDRLYSLVKSGGICDDPELLTSFYDILLRILEDEERDVRFVGQKIVAELEKRHKFTDQTSSIETVLDMLLDKPFHKVIARDPSVTDKFTVSIVDHFVERMFDNSNLADCRSELRHNEIYNDEVEFLLFEKEQKNVFSEPYLMSTRIGSFLMMILHRTPKYFAEHFTRPLRISILDKNVQDFEAILDNIEFARIEKLVLLSIWRLPDFINRLVNLYYLLKMSVFLVPNLKYCRIIQRMDDNFPYLKKNASLVARERNADDVLMGRIDDLVIAQ